MGDLQSLPGQQDGKTAASGSAVKHRVNSVQVFQEFMLDMAFLHDVVNKGLLAFRFPFSLVGKVPHSFGNSGTVLHSVSSFRCAINENAPNNTPPGTICGVAQNVHHTQTVLNIS